MKIIKFWIFLLILLFMCCKSAKTARQGRAKLNYYNALHLGDKETTKKHEKKFHEATKKKH